MPRSLILLIVIIAALIGGLFWLAGRDSEVEPVRVEKAVSLENLTQ